MLRFIRRLCSALSRPGGRAFLARMLARPFSFRIAAALCFYAADSPERAVKLCRSVYRENPREYRAAGLLCMILRRCRRDAESDALYEDFLEKAASGLDGPALAFVARAAGRVYDSLEYLGRSGEEGRDELCRTWLRLGFPERALACADSSPDNGMRKRIDAVYRTLEVPLPEAPRKDGGSGELLVPELTFEKAVDVLLADRAGGDRHRAGNVPGLLCSVGYGLGCGGAERQHVETLRYVAGATSLPCPVALFFSLDPLRGDDFFLHVLNDTGVRVHCFQAPAGHEHLGALRETLEAGLDGTRFQRLSWLVSMFLRLRPRAVQAWLDETSLLAGLAGLVARVPKIVLLAGSLPPDKGRTASQDYRAGIRYMRRAYRALCRHPSIVPACNCRAGADEYAGWIGIEPSGFSVIYNGIRQDRVSSLPSDNEGDRSLFTFPGDFRPVALLGAVFRLVEEKDPALWLEIVARLAAERPGLGFVLAGDGPLMPVVRKKAAELGLAGRLLFLGRLEDPGSLYTVIDVFLLASRVEGLANVVLEAQAAGVPVVVADVGGLAEAVEQGETGFLVDGREPSAFADKVSWILDNPDWRQAVRQRAPGFVSGRFSMRASVGSLLSLAGLADETI